MFLLPSSALPGYGESDFVDIVDGEQPEKLGGKRGSGMKTTNHTHGFLVFVERHFLVFTRVL